MKVLHILEASGGGTARHIIDLCLGLVDHSIETHLAYSSKRIDLLMKMGLKQLDSKGVKLYEFSTSTYPSLSDVSVLLYLLKIIRLNKYDIIHGHSSKGGALARLLKLFCSSKVVYTPHAISTMSTTMPLLQKSIFSLFESILSHVTDYTICGSVSEEKIVKKLGYVNRTIIHNGVRFKNKVEICIPDSTDPSNTPLTLCFIGRLVPQKDPLFLIECFSKLITEFSDTKLIIVGSGILFDECVNRARNTGLSDSIIFTSEKASEEYIDKADIICASSQYESFLYVIVEAMAKGKPVVTTSVGIAPELVINGYNGYVVPVGDKSGYYEALRRIVYEIKFLNKRNYYFRNCIMSVQNFTVEQMVDRTISLYSSLLRKNKR